MFNIEDNTLERFLQFSKKKFIYTSGIFTRYHTDQCIFTKTGTKRHKKVENTAALRKKKDHNHTKRFCSYQRLICTICIQAN